MKLSNTLNVVCTVQGKVKAVSVPSHNLTLSHSEVQVTYRCLLSADGQESVSVNVSSGETVTVTALPDTLYTIGCLGYDEQGQDLCVEGNTTITTCEHRHNKEEYMCMHVYSTHSACTTYIRNVMYTN